MHPRTKKTYQTGKRATNSNCDCVLYRMASSPENNASLCDQKVTHAESPQAKKSQQAEEAIFYKNCRAAYLTVLKSSLENIKSKEQLRLGNDLFFFPPITVVCGDCHG